MDLSKQAISSKRGRLFEYVSLRILNLSVGLILEFLIAAEVQNSLSSISRSLS